MKIDSVTTASKSRQAGVDHRPAKTTDKLSVAVAAEETLAAFLSAVDRNYGPLIVKRAGEYWLDAFNAIAPKFDATATDWRRVTIAAASRLADDLRGKEEPLDPLFIYRSAPFTTQVYAMRALTNIK